MFVPKYRLLKKHETFAKSPNLLINSKQKNKIPHVIKLTLPTSLPANMYAMEVTLDLGTRNRISLGGIFFFWKFWKICEKIGNIIENFGFWGFGKFWVLEFFVF
tara:strand:- start:393 stop:704 length:312 start_codon:yes stop_codon:yes gene_type:complete